MKPVLLLWMMLCGVMHVFAQHTISLSVKEAGTRQLLAGASATITPLQRTAVADSTGTIVFNNIPAGSYTISVSYVGMESYTAHVTVVNENIALQILLQPAMSRKK
jgi:hypothetical protein